MFSTDQLQEAAESLGLMSTRKGSSLRIQLDQGVSLDVLQADGKTTLRRRYGLAPEWYWNLFLTLAIGSGTFLFIRTFPSAWSVIALLGLLAALYGLSVTSVRVQRAQEKLFSRAYELKNKAV